MKKKKILFDKDDMDHINEYMARDYADRTGAQISATLMALIAFIGAGTFADKAPKFALGLAAIGILLAIIGWLADPDKRKGPF